MRYGYNGPVTIGLADPPAGVTFRPGIIPSGQTVGVFSVSVAPEATVGAMVLKVVGTGKDGDRVIEVAAEKPVSYAQIGNLPTKILTQQGLAAAPMQVRPVVLDVPEAVEAVHGLGTPVVIKSVRGEKGEGELALSTLPLSAGIQIPNAKIDAKAAEGTATVNVATEAPFESFSVALTAKGKIDGKDQTFFTPSVRLNLIRPTSLELETKQVEIKAGGTVEVKGKLTRKGGHKEPITVKIDGLPAGLKADPVTVAPESVDFVLKVTAEGSAAEATATAKLALAFKIGGKDYPFPTTDLPVKVVK
jgi:hypothetical protein